MKERVLVELRDLVEYIDYSQTIYPVKKFIEYCKKKKLNHLAGAGWLVIEKDKLPYVIDNCVIWLDDKSVVHVTFESFYDKEKVTLDLSEYMKLNKSAIGILWIDRIFDIE